MHYEIIRWLREEGPFLTGLDLYRRLGDGKGLIDLEQAARQELISPQVYDQLVGYLQALVPDGEFDIKATVKVKNNQTEEPDAIKALRAQGRIFKKRESDIHGRMKALAEQSTPALYEEDLYELAREMMEEVQPELDRIYGQIRAWEQQGRLPVPGAEKIVQATVQKMKRLESIRTRSSAIKRKLKTSLPQSEQKALEAELTAKIEEAKQIKLELGL